METKKCYVCGQELPISNFANHPATSDGKMGICQECRAQNKKHNNGVKLVVRPKEGCNPNLANFTPRELIAELKARELIIKELKL